MEPSILVPTRAARCRDALDVALTDQPQEAALWELLPPGGATDGTGSAAAAAAGSAATGGRPTLDEVLQRYGQLGVGGSGSGSSGSIQAAAGGGSGRSGRTASLATDIEQTIQQAEEAAQRARKEAQEALLRQGEQQPAGGSEQAYYAAAAAALRRADDRLGQPAFGTTEVAAAAAVGGGEVRMFVGVISACCSELAFKRRKVIRETWGKTVREVGRLGARREEGRLCTAGFVCGRLPARSCLAGRNTSRQSPPFFCCSATLGSTSASSWRSRPQARLRQPGYPPSRSGLAFSDAAPRSV
jgi:hypothetical protein